MIDTVATVVLMAPLGAWSVYRAFFSPPGALGTWAMFSHIVCYRVHLADSDGNPVVPWEYELPQDHFGNTHDLLTLVGYLNEEHHLDVSGEGVVTGPFGYVPVRVEKGGVIRGGVRVRQQ